MSALEVVMMRRIGELNEEIKRLAADSIKDVVLIAELREENDALRSRVAELEAAIVAGAIVPDAKPEDVSR